MKILDKIKRYFDFKRRNIKVWKPSNIYISARIGDNVSIGCFTEIGPNVEIGENTRIGMGCFIPEGVKIGKDCFIGPRSCFSNDFQPPSPKSEWRETVIEDNVSIGANVCIRPGIIVRRNSLLGMGTVVTHDVPEDEIWVGNPSRKLRKNGRKIATEKR